MKAPFASLCLLSYERRDFVMSTILSAIENADYPLEMIVHDDGSNANVVEVLRELHSDGFISLLMLNARGNNEGQGVALNRMFAAAKGDPIVKLDQDLMFSNGIRSGFVMGGWLKQSVQLLEANHKDARTPNIGALGLFKYEAEPVRWQDMRVATHSSGGYVWEEHKDFVGSAMVIPRVAWEEFGPFEERSPAFAEDAEFKRWIDEREGWCNALLPEDLAKNVGFGPGPSTIVSQEGGEIVVTKIHDGPKIIDR
jgi:glycosyltransferase involved in cell wall biosynthesis